MFRNIMNKKDSKIGTKMTNFLENGGMIAIFIVAIFGIILAIIGHYGTVEFNWKWFVFFELPLYIFVVWALYKAILMWKK